MVWFGEDDFVEVVGVVVVTDGRMGRDFPGPVGEVGVTADTRETLDGTHRQTESYGKAGAIRQLEVLGLV